MSRRAVEQLRALAHARQAEVAGLGGAERIDVAESVAVVGHAQLHARVDTAQRDRDGLGLGVPAGVDDRLLGDSEQVARDLRGQLEALDRDEHLESVAALPHRAGSSRSRSRRRAPPRRRGRGRRARRAAPGCCAPPARARPRAAQPRRRHGRPTRHCVPPTGSCRARSALGSGRRGSPRPRAGARRPRPGSSGATGCAPAVGSPTPTCAGCRRRTPWPAPTSTKTVS